ELGDVHTRSPVNVWRVLFGNEIHTHTEMLVSCALQTTNIWLWDALEFLEWFSLGARVSA
ncbi:MAG: hypothetical protein RL696_257, partial [Actinomycetota bacterium]